jgi:CDP-diacylglycerol--glycerol-3-phosphate 3-phosphatidyltransferase
MAILGGLRTRFGAILDSTCDRVSDSALYLGMVFYYLLRPEEWGGAAPNLTLAVLAAAGLVWAYLISYIKARAENEGAQAGGGFWQRPERVVTIMLGLGFHHLPTAIWILGVAPIATIAHRLWRARRTSANPAGADALGQGPAGLAGVVLWRWRRGTIPFDIQAGATIAALVFWDLPPIDPLRDVLARLIG